MGVSAVMLSLARGPQGTTPFPSEGGCLGASEVWAALRPPAGPVVSVWMLVANDVAGVVAGVGTTPLAKCRDIAGCGRTSFLLVASK